MSLRSSCVDQTFGHDGSAKTGGATAVALLEARHANATKASWMPCRHVSLVGCRASRVPRQRGSRFVFCSRPARLGREANLRGRPRRKLRWPGSGGGEPIVRAGLLGVFPGKHSWQRLPQAAAVGRHQSDCRQRRAPSRDRDQAAWQVESRSSVSCTLSLPRSA